MKQTKESFEAYLAECRAENKWGDRPPLDQIACPLCPGLEARLRCGPWAYWLGDIHYEGTHWDYICTNCEESWTTTESDAVSLGSLKLVTEPQK